MSLQSLSKGALTSGEATPNQRLTYVKVGAEAGRARSENHSVWMRRYRSASESYGFRLIDEAMAVLESRDVVIGMLVKDNRHSYKGQ